MGAIGEEGKKHERKREKKNKVRRSHGNAGSKLQRAEGPQRQPCSAGCGHGSGWRCLGRPRRATAAGMASEGNWAEALFARKGRRKENKKKERKRKEHYKKIYIQQRILATEFVPSLISDGNSVAKFFSIFSDLATDLAMEIP